MNTLILEDDNDQLFALTQIIESNFENVHVLKASTYDEASNIVKQYFINFFILDIKLDNNDSDTRSGLDFGYYLRSKTIYQFTPILYITAFPEKIFSAVNDVHCQNYIIKPYTSADVISAVEYLLQTPTATSPTIQICDRMGIYYKIPEKSILYIEACGKEMNIYYETDKHISTITTHKYRLGDFKTICSKNFQHCHRRFIVNIQKISSYDKCNALLQIQSHQIPIGRKYRTSIDYLFD